MKKQLRLAKDHSATNEGISQLLRVALVVFRTLVACCLLLVNLWHCLQTNVVGVANLVDVVRPLL